MKRLMILFAAVLIGACSDGNNNNGATTVEAPPETPAPVAPEPPAPAPAEAVFEVSATNLTVAQPLSPLAVLIHDQGIAAFALGEPASLGIEVMAEGGDNSELLDSVDSLAEISGDAPVGPGGADTVELTLDESSLADARLTVLSMLVNTNDAFTGVNALDVSSMVVGDSVTLNGNSYDSGTEANTESATLIPGPAGGGEGFNAARDDVRDQVTFHPGVVTSDDGLSSSDLGQQHRWDNPVARITITRTR